MPHLQSHTCKMATMIVMVLSYFVVELVIGHFLNSISLVADSFHMLSDFVALVIGIAARKISKWPKSTKNTFGWQRAEVVGALLNTVMLSTLTFTIFIDAIQRFIKPEHVEKPRILFGVGAGGLLINIIGLIILRGNHGHSHHGNETIQVLLKDDILTAIDGNPGGDVVMPGSFHEIAKEKNHKVGTVTNNNASHMNIRAVFLHVLADFFGSVVVCISALILWLVPDSKDSQKDKWKYYIDPSISLLMVFLILGTTIPLLKQTALILLQSVPKEVSVTDLKTRMEQIDGIEKVHDLHVWLLQSDVIIGTVHIRCANENYVKVSKEAKKLFHDFNIHCTTIQAEFDEHAEDSTSKKSTEAADGQCYLGCDDKSPIPGNSECKAKSSCCPTRNSSSVALSNHLGSGCRNDDGPITVTVREPLLPYQWSVPCLTAADEPTQQSVHRSHNSTTQLTDIIEPPPQ